MKNKPSRFNGYNQAGFTLNSGNVGNTPIALDFHDVGWVSQGGMGGGGTSNDPWIKNYIALMPTDYRMKPAFVTLPSAMPTGVGAIGYGTPNGMPMWVALTNSTTITSGALMYSQDGVNWTAATLPSAPGGAWESIAYGNGRFVAVAATTSTTAGIAYSYDGINWAYATTTAPGGNWAKVKFGGTLGKGVFVALATANTTTTSIATSPDGITWTYQTAVAGAGNFTDCAWGNPANNSTGLWVFTHLGNTTNTTVYTSVPTGGTLGAFAAITLPTAPAGTGVVGVAYSPVANVLQTSGIGFNTSSYTGFFSLICGATTASSTGVLYTYDGTTALNVTSPATPAGSAWLGIVWGQGSFYAFNGSTAVNNALMQSFDGVNWNFVQFPGSPGGAWNAIYVGDRLGGRMIIGANAAVAGGSIAQQIVGPAILVEVSGGDMAEGTPDYYIVGNQENYQPDISRFN